MDKSLPQLLLDGLTGPVRARLAADPDLPARLDAILARTAERWPNLTLHPAVFVPYLARRIEALGENVDLDQLHTDDLFLACACLTGVEGALATFEQTFIPPTRRAMARLRLSRAQEDDVIQRIRCDLFVGRPDLPQIKDYAGRGTLQSWTTSIAIHAGLKLVRERKRFVDTDNDQLMWLADAVDDPVLSGLKSAHAEQFRIAFADAVQALPRRHRKLLRQQLLEGMTLDALAELHSVHRATVARWLAKAREQVLEGTRRALMQALDVGRTDVDSIMRLARSQLDLSIHRLLATKVDKTE